MTFWVVNAGPGVWVDDLSEERSKEPAGVGHVDDDDDEADGEEADEAGFCGIAGGDEAQEFAAVAKETVG